MSYIYTSPGGQKHTVLIGTPILTYQETQDIIRASGFGSGGPPAFVKLLKAGLTQQQATQALNRNLGEITQAIKQGVSPVAAVTTVSTQETILANVPQKESNISPALLLGGLLLLLVLI